MVTVAQPIVPRFLYRFRSLSRATNTPGQDAVEQEIDSIVNNYLYCPSFESMNDPMEGFYSPTRPLSRDSYYAQIAEGISKAKFGIGFACFTEAHDNVLMWAHYAGNYAGICLKYSTEQFDALSSLISLIRLSYVDEPPALDISDVTNPFDAARRILSQKKYNWAYEREWRILGTVGKQEFGLYQAVDSIYFGSRVNDTQRNRILEAIRGTEIKAYIMEVDGYEHKWERCHP